MIVVDVNLLVYASNQHAPQHLAAWNWWRGAVNGAETIGLAWSVVIGFLRVTTHPRILATPLTPAGAMAVVDGWFAQRSITPLEPTEAHWQVLKTLLTQVGLAGNLTSDAHLAALAIEHGARLYSADTDFARFPGLRWVNPLATPAPPR